VSSVVSRAAGVSPSSRVSVVLIVDGEDPEARSAGRGSNGVSTSTPLGTWEALCRITVGRDGRCTN